MHGFDPIAADKPIITTIIPSYRRPHLVRRAVLSALGQSYPYVRVCVYDNASGDKTYEAIADLVATGKVEYYCHEKNIGSYPNFNFGLSRVSTPFFSLLSDDDALAPDFYEHAMRAFESYPDAKFVCMGTLVVDQAGIVISGPADPVDPIYYRSGEGFKPMARVEIPRNWTGMVFRKEVVELIGHVAEDAGPFADGGFVLHAAARFPFVVSPGIGGVLMSHPVSTSGTAGNLQTDWTLWWNKMVNRIEQDSAVPDAVKVHARTLMRPQVLRIAIFQISRALREERIGDAVALTKTLAVLDHPFAAKLFRVGVFVYRRFPGLRAIGFYIKKIHDRRICRANRALHMRWGRYVEFLHGLK